MSTGVPDFDPQWLQAEAMMGGRMTLPAEPAEQARARFDAIFQNIAPLLPPVTDAVEAINKTVPSTNKAVRIYRPTKFEGQTLPVGLYIHSGGWYTGSIDHEDFLCRNIAENAGIILYSPEYRLAPENPYPAGLDDVCAAYEYLHQTASEYKGDPTKKFIMGGSAGGNLTLAVALRYALNPQLKASGMCAFCVASCAPPTMPEGYKSRYTPELYKEMPMIGTDILVQAADWYAAPPTDPLYSVLLHPDIKSLPQTYLSSGTNDPCYQETMFFKEECEKQGVKVDWVEWSGMPHFFWTLPMLPKSQEFMKTWAEKLKGMYTPA